MLEFFPELLACQIKFLFLKMGRVIGGDCCWIIDGPVVLFALSQCGGAVFFRAEANDDVHIFRDRIKSLRLVGADIQAHFGHGFNGERVNAGRSAAGAEDGDPEWGHCPRHRFCHLTSS